MNRCYPPDNLPALTLLDFLSPQPYIFQRLDSVAALVPADMEMTANLTLPDNPIFGLTLEISPHPQGDDISDLLHSVHW